jgi:hypothetical protein
MSTKGYEVRVRYQGVSTYFVEAHDEEEAADLARARYRNGGPDETTGSEYEEIVGTDVRAIAATLPPVSSAEAAFKILTTKLLDAAYRYTPGRGSDTLRAYCTVLLDLDWRGERVAAIRDTLHKVAFYAASGAIEETRIGARHISNMVNGREWYEGNGRAG